MSRSRKKTPISGNAGGSEKKDKIIWHQNWRSTVRKRLRHGHDVDDLADERSVSNPWGMSKDGKVWRDPKKNGDKKWFKKMMRK